MNFSIRTTIAWLGLLCLPCSVPAEEFAIRSRIFEPGESQPVAENLTVVQDQKIYDFELTGAKLITEFDVAERRFVICDPGKAEQTTISADELVRFAAARQAQSAQSKYPLVRFAADPKFEESYDEKTGKLQLTSELWEYEVATAAWGNQWQQQRYGEFVNWYTYLNSMFSPLSPALRLELNRSLDRLGRYPTQVQMRVKENGKTIVERESRHELVLELSSDAQQRVKKWQREQPSMKPITFTTYHAAQLQRLEAR